jgi:hypothetical protein
MERLEKTVPEDAFSVRELNSHIGDIYDAEKVLVLARWPRIQRRQARQILRPHAWRHDRLEMPVHLAPSSARSEATRYVPPSMAHPRQLSAAAVREPFT